MRCEAGASAFAALADSDEDCSSELDERQGSLGDDSCDELSPKEVEAADSSGTEEFGPCVLSAVNGNLDVDVCMKAKHAESHVTALRAEWNVDVRLLPGNLEPPEALYKPVLSFFELTTRGVPAQLVEDAVRSAGFASSPTPVQAECWGLLLAPAASGTSTGSTCMVREELDLIGLAPTGSGKTLAYLMPVLADGLCRLPGKMVQLADVFAQFEKLFPQSFPEAQGQNAALLSRLRRLYAAGDTVSLVSCLKAVLGKAIGGKDQALVDDWRCLQDDLAHVGLLAPRALVLAPTRELAQQVVDVAASLCSACLAVVGGVDHQQQRAQLQADMPSLLVATPGRLRAFCGELPSSTRRRQTRDGEAPVPAPALHLRFIRRFVLDEGDRLLDEGFEEDIQALNRHAGQRSLTMLFSATWTPRTESVAAMLRPAAVRIELVDVLRTISQNVELVPKTARGRRLKEALSEFGSKAKVLVFVLYRKEAKDIAKMIEAEGHQVWALAGDMSQSARMNAMRGFRAAERGVLVATDVAARGLDVPDVTHVVNFSLGLSAESYVHRVGRCGRAGRRGTAVTFITDGDERHAAPLLQVLEKGSHVVPPGLREMALSYAQSGGSCKLTVQHSRAGGGEVLIKTKAHPGKDEDDAGSDSDNGKTRQARHGCRPKGKGASKGRR